MKSYIPLIITIVIIGFVIIGLWLTIYQLKTMEKEKLNKILFSIVSDVESKYGNGTGKLKLAKAAEIVYDKIPNFLKIFFTIDDIENMIEIALSSAKEIWTSDPNIKKEIGITTISAEEIQQKTEQISNEVLEK